MVSLLTNADETARTFNNADEIARASYEQTEYALKTGQDVGSIGAGKPGEVGCVPPDLRTYDDAVSGVNAVGWHQKHGSGAQVPYRT